MFQSVFFDIDNTLLLKKPSIPEKVLEIAARYDPTVSIDAVEKAYAASELWQGRQILRENETGIRMPDKEYMAHVAKIFGKALTMGSAAVQELIDRFQQNDNPDYVLAPGVPEILEQLSETGIRLGIVSNNYPAVRTVLENMGIGKFFDPIIISEEAGLCKPDPAILELACSRAGVQPEQSLYVGDHPFDILCAHAAHMPVVWLPCNRFMEAPDSIGAPEYTAASLKDACHYIIKENKKG